MSYSEILSLLTGVLLLFGGHLLRSASRQINENRQKLSRHGERLASLEASQALLRDIRELLTRALHRRR